MKHIFIIALLCLGCRGEATHVNKTSNPDFEVEFLFEHDGCRVYRFWDGTRRIYYTTCEGSTSWLQDHGKNASTQENVQTFKSIRIKTEEGTEDIYYK